MVTVSINASGSIGARIINTVVFINVLLTEVNDVLDLSYGFI
jgi:hypothetical protein